jgi:hypothetical protein
MSKSSRWLAANAAVVLLASAASAASAQQAPAAAPTFYVSISYIKAMPGQGAAYRTWISTMSKRFYNELMSADPSFVHWDCTQNMYQGTDQQAFDYMCVTVTQGSPLDPARDLEPIFRKMGTTSADYQAKLATMRTVVGTDLLRRMAGTSATSTGTTTEGNYRVTNQLRVSAGMGDEFSSRTTTLTLPLMQARVGMGDGLKSWSMWTRLFPNGAATDYDMLAVTGHATLASAVGGGGNPNTLAELFMKVHPDRSLTTYINNGRDYSSSQRRMISRVLAVVERN